MRMKFISGVQFSTKELQDLVAVSVSCVRVARRVRHIALLPNCLGDVKSSINGILNSYKNKFDDSFNGFILGYKNVKIITDRATIINDDSYLHIDVEADFYIFTPEVGCTLVGIVNKKSVDHIGCLVHKCFHVAIPRSTEETDGEWLGTSVNIGDQVTFRVEVCDFTGSLPYIRGKLINVSSGYGTSVKEGEGDGISEPKKKKKKKNHKESDSISQGAECNLMVNSVEPEKIEQVLATNHKKRKRHVEDEGGTGTERKRKKRDVEGHKSVYYETPENEELHFTRLSSEDAEYGTILESLKETYLNEAGGDLKAHKKKKKGKHKLCTDTNEGKETVAEVIEDLQHANEGNGDEVFYPDHVPSVKKMHHNKKKRKEKSVGGNDMPAAKEGSSEHNMGAHTQNRNEEHIKTVPGSVELLNRTESLTSASASGKDDLCLYSTSTFLTSSTAALRQTRVQETDVDVQGSSTKAKKKKNKKHDSHIKESFDVQSKTEACTSLQKSPVKNNMESNSILRVQKHNSRKDKLKKHDSHNGEMLDVQSKASTSSMEKSTVADNLVTNIEVKPHKAREEKKKKHGAAVRENKSAEHTVGCHTENGEEDQQTIVPSNVELLNTSEHLMTVSSSKQNDSYVARASLIPAAKIADLPVASLQETDFDKKDLAPKAKKRKAKRHDSNDEELHGELIKGDLFTSLQKSPLKSFPLKKLESSSDMKYQHSKAKKKKKRHESQSRILSDVQNEGESSVRLDKSAEEHSLGSSTGNRDGKQVELFPSTTALVNTTEDFTPPSSSRQTDTFVSGTSPFLTACIAALPRTSSQETGSDMKDMSPKAKKKKVKNHDVHSGEPPYILSKIEESVSSQKPPVMHDVESNVEIKDQNCKANSGNRETCNLKGKELSSTRNESDKPSANEESLLGHEISVGNQSLGSVTGNADEDRVMAVPSIADLLNSAKSKLKVKLSKKHKKKRELNQIRSEGSGVPKITFEARGFHHRKGTKHDSSELHCNVSNEKRTEIDISKQRADVVMDGIVEKGGENKTQIADNKVVESVDGSALVKRVSSHYNDNFNETERDKSDSHVAAFAHVENKGKKSDKSRHNKKQHNSKKSKDKASVSFDPTALLAKYMSKFEAAVKNDTANEYHSSEENAVDATTSNPSFRSSFSLTGSGMANAGDRKRKKMNKGKGDAMPVRRSLPLLPSSHLSIAADKPVGQDVVGSQSIESCSESVMSSVSVAPKLAEKTVSAYERDVLLTPEKYATHNEISRFPKTSISNTLDMLLASPKEGQVTSPEKTPSRSILLQKGTSDSDLPTVVSASSRKNSNQASDIHSPKTKDQAQISSGFKHYLNMSKLPTNDKGCGSDSGREFVNASLILPQHSEVLQRLKSPSADSGMSEGMTEISSGKEKSVDEVSTGLVKETVTTESKDKHKKKKKHKEKKSEIKYNKYREHKERKQKKKNVKDHKRNKGELESSLGIQEELADTRGEHKEENTGTKNSVEKQGMSNEKDTKGNLEDLKTLASKLFSSFLQQEKR